MKDDYDNSSGHDESYEGEFADEFMKSISEEIGRQVEEEIKDGQEQPEYDYDTDETPYDEETEEMGRENQKNGNGNGKRRKRKKHTGLKIACGVLGVLVLCGVFLVGTPIGRRLVVRMVVGLVEGGLNREEPVPVTDPEGNIMTDEKGNMIVEHEKPNTHESPADARSEDYVTNIMLVGIESVLPGSRADTIMIASLDTKEKKIKLTSILRDTYVQIPGFNKSKINSAYGKGGIKTMYETIEQNFKIKLDGYVLVGFDGLETIIDKVGGIDIELTAQEARYLNTTNYVSNVKYRTLKEGVNHMNGNQVVGYCRVRKIPTLGGANYDFGRTLRQRRVLTTVFEAYKSKGLLELVGLMNDLFGYVTTDLTAKQMEDLLVDFIEEHITEIDSLRIPAEGAYTGRDIKGVGSVLDPDLEKNIEIMYEFIFDDKPEEEATTAAAK